MRRRGCGVDPTCHGRRGYGSAWRPEQVSSVDDDSRLISQLPEGVAVLERSWVCRALGVSRRSVSDCTRRARCP